MCSITVTKATGAMRKTAPGSKRAQVKAGRPTQAASRTGVRSTAPVKRATT